MYLVDSAVWVALSIAEHEHYAVAREWLDSVSQMDSVHFCRATQQSMLRLLTTSSILARYGYLPQSNTDAWRTYEAFIADDRIGFRDQEPKGLERRWKDYSARASASPKLWMDAYLAAFAVMGGYQLVTTDAAYRQFDGLDLVLLGDQQS